MDIIGYEIIYMESLMSMKIYPIEAQQVRYNGGIYLRQVVPHVSSMVFWYDVVNEEYPGGSRFELITDVKRILKLDAAYAKFKEGELQ